ncbi:MAG: carboxylating nicotinate-nucleotide diphosphorylase [Porticoccaceae bacterium]
MSNGVMIDAKLQADIAASVARALAEDIGDGDITAALIPAGRIAKAVIVTREAAVVCGIPWVAAVFGQLDAGIAIHWQVAESDDIAPGQQLCTLAGNARALLTGERTALNFLQTLSGTATAARTYARLAKGSAVRVLDTRKTIPGLRLAQKYAVRVGGCHNHRIGLYDAFLIKENHIAACGGIGAAVSRARAIAPGRMVEVEVETIDELREALAARADRVMLDNFTTAAIAEATALTRSAGVDVEVSGNIDADNLARYAQSGVDFVSSGALTKHCRAIDYSLRLIL